MIDSFACFGSTCTVDIDAPTWPRRARDAAEYGEDLSASLDLREALARAPRRTAARPAPSHPPSTSTSSA